RGRAGRRLGRRRRDGRRRGGRRDVGDHGPGERTGDREAEHEEQNGVPALHGTGSVALKDPGSSDTIPSTPRAVNRCAEAASLTVQTRTGTPSRWAVATAAREQSAWWSASAFARAAHSS